MMIHAPQKGVFFCENTKMNEVKEKIKIAENRLLLYLRAEEAILSGQSYKIGDRELTRANLKDVVSAINSLKKEIGELNTILKGRSRVKIVRPRW